MFKALATRIKALFFTNAALDVEAEFLSRSAERKAQFLDEADRYEKDGKADLAKEPRKNNLVNFSFCAELQYSSILHGIRMVLGGGMPFPRRLL